MRLRIFLRTSALAVGALWLTQCTQLPQRGAPTAPSVRDVQAMREGAQLHKAILLRHPALSNDELQTYVNEVGLRLADKRRSAGFKWHFTVLDDADLRTFALPGGYVYVTRGVLNFLNSEAELAAVIAHQIAHVLADSDLGRARVPGTTVTESVLVPALNHPDQRRVESMLQTSTAGQNLAREQQADKRAVQYLAEAGYAPQALLDAQAQLARAARLDAAGVQHPPRDAHWPGAAGAETAAYRTAVADEVKRYTVPHAQERRGDYLWNLEGLSFDDSYASGVIRGQALLLEKPGVGLDFPQGWRIESQAARIVAFSPQDDALLEFRQGPAHARSMETLRKNLLLDPGARFVRGNISGYSASFVAGAMQGRPVLASAVVVRGAQYLIAGLSRDVAAYNAHRDALKAAINSFHNLDPEMRRRARPRRIHVVTVEAGDSMAQFARTSPLGVGAEKRLRALNGMPPGVEPQPGRLLKIVD